MSWFSSWFASPRKRALDDDIHSQGKKARVLFEERADSKVEFIDEPFVTLGLDKSEQLGQLVSSSLVPRPFTLVATINKQNELSLVPTSFCSLVSVNPTCLCIGLSKDTLAEELPVSPADNIAETKELTVSIVSEWIAQAASVSTGTYELSPETTEADLKTGLTTADSEQVTVPRISESAVVLECKVRHRYNIKDSEGEVASTVVIAEVLCAAVKKGVLAETGAGGEMVDTKKLRPVAALGSELCAQVSDFYRLPVTLSSPASPQTPTGDLDSKPQEELAEAVAEAVAEALDAGPSGSAVKAVTVTLGEETAATPGEEDVVPVTVVHE